MTAAERRIAQAEDLLFGAAELLEKAQAKISVIVGGLHQDWTKIGILREKVKLQMYGLRHARESGECVMDETVLRRKKA